MSSTNKTSIATCNNEVSLSDSLSSMTVSTPVQSEHNNQIIGEGSIRTRCQDDVLLCDLPEVTQNKPNFFLCWNVPLDCENRHFKIGEGGSLDISSFILSGEPCFSKCMELTQPIIHCFESPQPVFQDTKRVLNSLIVKTTGSRPLEEAKLSQIHLNMFDRNRKLPRGHLSGLKVLVPLFYEHLNILMSPHIPSHFSYYDNSYLYAKLLTYAFTLSHFEMLNVTPVAEDWPVPNVGPTWVDLNSMENYQTLANTLENIVFSEQILLLDEDIPFNNPNYIQVVHWLTNPGRRLNGPPGGRTPHSTYIEWDPIPIAVLSRYPLPELFQPTVPSAYFLKSFARTLACRRNEWGSFQKGLYAAMEIVGHRLVEDTNNKGTFWPISSNMSTHTELTMPTPRDYNFLIKKLGYYPEYQKETKDDIEGFLFCDAAQRMRAVTLYNAMYAAATTTYLYDFNITTKFIENWCMGQPMEPLARGLCLKLFQTREYNMEPMEPCIRGCPRAAFQQWLGCTVFDGLFPLTPWNGSYGGNLHVKISFGDQTIPGDVTPRWCSPLVVDNFLIKRPLEWGITELSPEVDFRREVVYNSLDPGWYANGGSKQYTDNAGSQEPFKIVAYQNYALNVICQALQLQAPPLLSWTAAPWRPRGSKHPYLRQTDKITELTPNAYHSQVHTIEPCTVMTFNWQSQVLIPWIKHSDLGLKLYQLECFSGQALKYCGIRLLHHFQPLVPKLKMDFSRFIRN